MGQLIPQKKLQDNTIKEYLQQVSNDYSMLMEGSPTFVTYYSQDENASTTDQGLENVVKLVGQESPVKYRKVKDFALYGIDAAQIETSYTDFGMNTEMDGEATIIPNTLKPVPNDYFTISYDGQDILFKVTDVQIDKTRGPKFFKAQFTMSRDSAEFIEEQISKTYEMVYERIGRGQVLIEEEASITLKRIDDLMFSMINFFDVNFRHKKFDIFWLNYGGYNWYNEHLIRFIRDNDLFRRPGYYTSIHVQDLYPEDGALHEIYGATIYAALENFDASYLAVENFWPAWIQEPNMPFYQYYDKFYFTMYDIQCPDDQTTFVVPHNGTFVDNVKTGTLYRKGEVKPLLKAGGNPGKFVTDSSGNFLTDSSGNFLKDSSGNYLTDASGNLFTDASGNLTDSSGNIVLNDDGDRVSADSVEPSEIAFVEDSVYALENVVIKYLNGKLDFDVPFLEYLNSLKIRAGLQSFLLLPCILFILKDYKSKLMA